MLSAASRIKAEGKNQNTCLNGWCGVDFTCESLVETKTGIPVLPSFKSLRPYLSTFCESRITHVLGSHCFHISQTPLGLITPACLQCEGKEIRVNESHVLVVSLDSCHAPIAWEGAYTRAMPGHRVTLLCH